jgi:hypothetical protein
VKVDLAMIVLHYVENVCQSVGRYRTNYFIVNSKMGGAEEGAAEARPKRTITISSFVTLNTTRVFAIRRRSMSGEVP